jgi:hypothetical protein
VPPSSGSNNKPSKQRTVLLCLLIVCLAYPSTLKREAVRPSETSINFFQIGFYVLKALTIKSSISGV